MTTPRPEHNVVERLRSAGIVPVATVEDPGQAPELARALAAGGLPCLEIAFRHPAAVEALRRAAEVEGILVGAGTVLSREQAEAAAAAGAHFAVAPGTDAEIVAACRELGLAFFPGAATPTEIQHARRLECGVVKLFPISTLGGPAFIRAVSATYPDMGYLPTGGIGPDDVAAYLALPTVVACGGSWIVRADLLREGRFDEIERLAREAVESRR